MDKELDAKLFKKYSSNMIKTILNPVEVADKLYASEIIDAPTRDRVQMSDNGANDLIIAVEAFILSQPESGKKSGMSEKFKEILEIFKKYIPLNYVVKVLEDEYHKLEQEIDSKKERDSNASLRKNNADLITTGNHEDIHKIDITPSEFQDISQKEKWEAPIKPVLLMTGGLPKSGKTRAIKQLLNLSDDDPSTKRGFAHYGVISVGQKSVKSKDTQVLNDFGLLAGMKLNYSEEVDNFKEDPPVALDSTFAKYRKSLTEIWKMLKETADLQNLLHSNHLRKGIALVKIWDISFDSFSSQFLRCFNGHFYNSHMWSFTDVERDQRSLSVPPLKDETKLLARRSRIQYLLNPSKLSSDLNNKRENVCTMFATHEGVTNDAIRMNQQKLQNECINASSQIGCSKLIEKEILTICFNMSIVRSNRKMFINKLQEAIPKAFQDIPLSHMFLRGSLEFEPSVFMRREELKRRALLCRIDKNGLVTFCKSFTSFGSIIDVGLVSTSDIIIVKPDEFLTTLDQAFNFERIKDYQVAHDGILTSDVAFSLLGKEYELFLEVLEAVGLATPVAGGQCQPPQDRMCYYIPSMRLHGEEINFNPNRIQLVTSMRYPSISLIVALTKHLLQAIPNSQLMLLMARNTTRIISPKSVVEIVFHGEIIEFAVVPEGDVRFIKEIVKACKKLPYQLKNRYGKAKFYFAVLCKKHDNYIGFNFYRKRHILPIASDEFDCDKCTFTENMKIWSSAINEVGVNEKFKPDGKITKKNSLRLSAEISTYQHVHVLAFINALDQDRQLPDDQSQWEDVLMAAIAEWKLQPRNRKFTKTKMAVILIELHMKFKHSYTETRLRFKQLARQLDIQTLTMEQIKHLSMYYRDKQAIEFEMLRKDQTMTNEKMQQSEEKLQELISQQNTSENTFDYQAEEKEKSETQLLQTIEMHIEKEGTLNVTVVKGLLYGPPRVGKTSLMRRLIGEEPEPPGECASTGIDSPISVPIYKESQFVSMMIHENEWHRLSDLKETLRTLLNFVPRTNEQKNSAKFESPNKNEQSSKETSSQADDSMITDDEDEESSDTESTISEESNDETLPGSLAITDDVTDQNKDNIKEPVNLGLHPEIADLIKDEEWEKIREKLKGLESMMLFQMVDVGGQPEFHDILPLLLTGPALYFLFLNLDQKLDEKYTYQYQHKDGSNSTSYTSQLTVFQVLHQILSTIGSSSDDGTSAIIIGTHRDKVTEEQYKEIDFDLKTKMKGNAYYERIKYIGDNIVFPVNNLSGKMEDEIIPLRERIKRFLSKFKGESLPTTFALFYYLLQYQPTKKIFTLNEARNLAKGLKIDDKVEDVLKFIHNKFGSVLYYDDVYNKNGERLVFCDPNVILQAVNELVAVCFGANPDDKATADDLRDTGTITPEKLEKLCQSFNDDSPHLKDYIISLLKKRHILTSVSVKGTEMFFIPCLLHSSDNTKYTPLQNEEVAPFLLKLLHKTSSKFLNFIPPGLFTSTIVKLSEIWELSRMRCYKNKVSFQINSLSAVTLIAQDEWIEVRMKRKPRGSPTCCEIRETIKNAIDDNKNDCLLAHFLDSVELDVGFYCPKDHYASKLPDTIHMACCYCDELEKTPYPLENKHKIWFYEDGKDSFISSDKHETNQVDDQNPQDKILFTSAETTPSSSQPSHSLPSSITKDQLKSIVRLLKQALNDNRVALNGIFQESLSSISNEMCQCRIITHEVQRSPSYDAIISNFEGGLSLKRTKRDIEGHCVKFLKALVNTGGPVEDAAVMIRQDWIERVKQELSIDLELSF